MLTERPRRSRGGWRGWEKREGLWRGSGTIAGYERCVENQSRLIEHCGKTRDVRCKITPKRKNCCEIFPKTYSFYHDYTCKGRRCRSWEQSWAAPSYWRLREIPDLTLSLKSYKKYWQPERQGGRQAWQSRGRQVWRREWSSRQRPPRWRRAPTPPCSATRTSPSYSWAQGSLTQKHLASKM